MSAQAWRRVLLLAAAIATFVAVVSYEVSYEQVTGVLAQTSPLTPTPTSAFPTPFVPTPGFPTPFFTPVGPPTGPQVTPTPTPDFRIVNEITFPSPGDAVSGLAPIVGTAVITDFVEYQVHISPAGDGNWSWLQTSRKVVRNGILHVLNTYQLKDGWYDVRVRAIRGNGNYSEAFLRNLEVRNANPPTPTPSVNAEGTPQPASPLLALPTQPPTPSPTPLFQSYVVNGQGIFEPQNGEVLRGTVTIAGTVNGKTYLNPFERYELYVAPSGSNQWSWLYSSQQQIWQAPIYTWDTTTLADGLYDLRLRIVYRDGNYDEYYVGRLRIANQGSGGKQPGSQPGKPGAGKTVPGIYFPLDNAQVTGVMQIVGTTAVPHLLRWEIYWSPHGADDWRFLVSDTQPIVNGTLANLDLSLLPAGTYDFRLRIVRQDLAHSDYDVINVQSTPPTPTPFPTVPS